MRIFNLPKKNLLTVHGADVIWQMSCGRRSCCGRRRCRSALHQQVAVGAPLAGHQVVVLARVGSRWGRGQAEEASLLQVFVGHCGTKEGRGRRAALVQKKLQTRKEK